MDETSGGQKVAVPSECAAWRSLASLKLSACESLFGSSPVGFTLLDSSLRHLYINPRLSEISGVSVQAHIGKTVAEVLPELAARVEPVLREVLRTGEPASHDISSQLGNAKGLAHYLAHYHRLQWGDEFLVSATVVEISELKRAQELLQSEREKADEVVRRINFHLENSPVAVTEWKSDFVLAYWSPQAERIFGWKAAEVLGKTPFEFGFVHEEDTEQVQGVNTRMNEGVDARSISFNRNYGKDGSVHYCEWYNSALHDSSGKLSSIFSIVLDTTDRQRAEDQLRAREQALRLAYEASGMWWWEIDPVTHQVRWPDDMDRPYEPYRNTNSASFEEWLTCVHPDDRERLNAQNLYALHDGGEFESEFRIIDADGAIRWIHNRGRLLQDPKGRHSRMLGVGMDITARKDAEASLTESEERLRLALDAAHMGAWDWNIRTGELKWSGDHEMMFGFRPGTFDGRFDTFLHAVHAEDRAQVLDVISECMRKCDPNYRGDFRVICPDGSIRWIHSVGKFTYDEAGKAVRLVGVNVDLTDRRSREEQQRADEARLRIALKAAKLGCWEWNIKTGETIWSDDLWQMFGLERDSSPLRYDLWLGVLHPEDRPAASAALWRAVERAEDFRFEFRCLWPDGSTRWMEALGTCVTDENGNPERLVGVDIDITDRKRSEEALRLNDRLAATGRMAASLAHEINNPLASVTNLLYLLEQQPLDSASQQFLSIASSELKRVAHITKNILGLYRESPVPVEVSICDILENVLGFYKPKIKANGVQVITRYEDACTVCGFPGELRQVFSNLVANSLEAMNDEGNLVIRTHSCRNSDVHGVSVLIADSGSGIPAVHAARVFEPFFTTKGEKGTGLGLWITTEIVRKHGGTVRVKTRTTAGSSGTVFRVFLPSNGRPERVVMANVAR